MPPEHPSFGLPALLHMLGAGQDDVDVPLSPAMRPVSVPECPFPVCIFRTWQTTRPVLL